MTWPTSRKRPAGIHFRILRKRPSQQAKTACAPAQLIFTFWEHMDTAGREKAGQQLRDLGYHVTSRARDERRLATVGAEELPPKACEEQLEIALIGLIQFLATLARCRNLRLH